MGHDQACHKKALKDGVDLTDRQAGAEGDGVTAWSKQKGETGRHRTGLHDER